MAGMSAQTSQSREGLVKQISGLDTRFWIVNIMEMFERLAYYGVRAVIAIYMVLPIESGGPQFTHVQKANIFAAWASVQSVLPVFTGGFADRYGHKRTIAVAILVKIVGYILMAIRMDYMGFFLGCMFLAAGTAIFKPGVQGTLAATLKQSNASVGWGIFYQLVNIGGFLGPVLAGVLRIMDWQYVFYSCAVIVAVNFLWLPFYTDPTQEGDGFNEEETASSFGALSQAVSWRTAAVWTGIWGVGLVYSTVLTVRAFQADDLNIEWMYLAWSLLFVVALGIYLPRKRVYDEGRADALSIFVVSVVGLFQHRVIWFCMLFAGFWLMFNQVFDLLPNVIDDWVDSSSLIASVGTAFQGVAIPTFLAIFLGVIFGGVCAAGVLLSMRPHERLSTDVPNGVYIVLALIFTGAALFPAKLGFGMLTAQAVGLAVLVGLIASGGAYMSRVHAKILAVVVAVVGGLAAIASIRIDLMSNAAGLIQMAEQGAQVPPEWMINMNPGLIVFTMVGFGYLTSFVRPLTSILLGMGIATGGALLAGTSIYGWACLGGIAVFSIGEMLSSPKKMEYLATLAKKGQEGVFMGYANMPVAVGWIVGSIYAGNAYEKTGDKKNLAKQHLETVFNMDPAVLEKMPRTELMPTLAEKMGGTVMEAQHMLYNTYHPEQIWYTIALIGVASIVGMIGYDRVISYLDRDSGPAGGQGSAADQPAS
jgi:dipeptide/tripeptide permease